MERLLKKFKQYENEIVSLETKFEETYHGISCGEIAAQITNLNSQKLFVPVTLIERNIKTAVEAKIMSFLFFTCGEYVTGRNFWSGRNPRLLKTLGCSAATYYNFLDKLVEQGILKRTVSYNPIVKRKINIHSFYTLEEKRKLSKSEYRRIQGVAVAAKTANYEKLETCLDLYKHYYAKGRICTVPVLFGNRAYSTKCDKKPAFKHILNGGRGSAGEPQTKHGWFRLDWRLKPERIEKFMRINESDSRGVGSYTTKGHLILDPDSEGAKRLVKMFLDACGIETFTTYTANKGEHVHLACEDSYTENLIVDYFKYFSRAKLDLIKNGHFYVLPCSIDSRDRRYKSNNKDVALITREVVIAGLKKLGHFGEGRVQERSSLTYDTNILAWEKKITEIKESEKEEPVSEKVIKEIYDAEEFVLKSAKKKFGEIVNDGKRNNTMIAILGWTNKYYPELDLTRIAEYINDNLFSKPLNRKELNNQIKYFRRR